MSLHHSTADSATPAGAAGCQHGQVAEERTPADGMARSGEPADSAVAARQNPDPEVVAKKRASQSTTAERADIVSDTAPWADEIDSSKLLDEVRRTVHRFIVCDESVATAAALWCAFTWFIDNVQVAPILQITAPDKRCGKSQLLDLVGRLSRRPLIASNISPAAVYRVIEAKLPTLLIDEADTFLRDNEQLRGIINSGHTRQTAYVVRADGKEFEPRRFSTWGAKAIAGIGRQAHTVMDRSIVLRLRRKQPHETVDKLRHVEGGLFDRLARQLARFAQDHGGAIRRARPALPHRLHDRAQDNWEPLLAIADVAGGHWPSIARKAAIRLTAANESSTESLSTLLLSDIRAVFDKEGSDKIATADLLKGLCDDVEKPWGGLQNGAPISDRRLAGLLSDFGIAPTSIKIGPSEVKRGYRREMFEDAFRRYLPSASADSGATLNEASSDAGSEVAEEVAVAQETPLPTLSEITGGRLLDDDPAGSITMGAADGGPPESKIGSGSV